MARQHTAALILTHAILVDLRLLVAAVGDVGELKFNWKLCAEVTKSKA